VDRSRWLLVAALALAILGVWALALSVVGRLNAQPSVTDVAGVPTSGLIATVQPTVSAPPPSPTIAPTAEPTASPMPTPTPTARPTAAPTEGAGDPRLRFVEFQLRLVDAGDDVQALNEALVEAAQAQDDAATVAAAVDMLDFVDRERDWLAAHPPAACYADAHAAAGPMLREYGAVAEAAIEYADATGLDRLEALATLLEQAEVAGDALRTLGDALEAATCLA
jgi:hypothetical protein